MSKKVQEKGRRAEERVWRLAQGLGNARMATREEDYGGKTDVVFNGHKIQVSVSPKSKRQRKRLEAMGITNIPGGDSIPDSFIVRLLKSLLS